MHEYPFVVNVEHDDVVIGADRPGHLGLVAQMAHLQRAAHTGPFLAAAARRPSASRASPPLDTVEVLQIRGSQLDLMTTLRPVA